MSNENQQSMPHRTGYMQEVKHGVNPFDFASNPPPPLGSISFISWNDIVHGDPFYMPRKVKTKEEREREEKAAKAALEALFGSCQAANDREIAILEKQAQELEKAIQQKKREAQTKAERNAKVDALKAKIAAMQEELSKL